MATIEELGFSRSHRKDSVDLSEEITNSDQVLAAWSISSDQLEEVFVSKLRAGSLRVDDYLQSTGFVTGVSGWQIKGDGTAEFVGITLSGGSLNYGKVSFSDSVNAGYYISSSGVYFGSAADASFIKYTIATGLLTLGNWNLNATSLYTGTEDHSGYTANAGDLTIYSSGSVASIHAKNFYIDTSGILNCTSAVISGGITTTAGSSVDGQYLTLASVSSASVNLALRGWNQTCAFTVTDADTISWGIGSFVDSGGTTYSILAGNTGNMSAKTYIYLDIAVSVTVYQSTTTASTAVGNGKVLIAIAENGTTEATFMLLNDSSYNINASNIVAGSITANEIAINTITADRLSVTSLSAITADLGTITSGTVTGATIQTSALATTGIKFDSTSLRGYNDLGVITFQLIPATGAFTTTSATIGSWSVNSTSIYTGTEDHSGYTANEGDITIYSDGSNASIHAKSFYVDSAGILNATGANITGTVTASTLIGGSIHIPDQDTTAASFHTNTAGNSWWGCTETSFTASNDNANAYILATGAAKFQNTIITGSSSISLGTGSSILKGNSTDGIWLGDATFASAVFSVSLAGAVKATSGTVGGWTLGASTLTGGDTSLTNTGIITVGTGDDVAILSSADATWRLWIGDSTNTDAPFRVDKDGNLVATSATISGSITATSGAIGGWNVVTGYLYSLASGTPTVTPNDGLVMASTNPAFIVYEDTAKRIEMGYLSSGVYGLKGYATNGTDVVFELSDTQQKIGGWYFTNSILRSGTTDANSNVFIDSTNGLIRFGQTTGDYLTADGANLRIRSSNYVSGMAGAGFTLEPDLLEVGNIACRGMLRTYVLQKDILSVNAGSLIIAPNADVLDQDTTSLDSSTLTIKGTVTFAVNDILRLKDGLDDEWLLVTNTASAPVYTVTRDLAEVYVSNNNPIWTKGASVVNYGQSGDGGLYLTASDTNAPYMSVYTHAGSPWSALTTQLRIGNLNGYLGYVADTYGFGVGSSTGTNANITIDPTNGIRMRNGTTNVFSLDNLGNASFSGSVSATSGYLGGWTILANSFTDTAGLVGLSSAVTAGDDIRLWAGHTTPSSAPLYFTEAGAFFASSATITGVITANTGKIGGTTNYWSIAAGDLSAVGAGDVAIRAGQTDYNTGTGLWLGLDSGTAKLSLGVSTGDFLTWDGSNIDVSGGLKNTIVVVAGENLTAGDCVCIRTSEINSVVASQDSMVAEDSASSNYGTDTTAVIGSYNNLGTADRWYFIKFDLASFNVPIADKAYIRLWVTAFDGNFNNYFETNAYLVDGAEWDESTITWTNKPAISASIGASMETAESNNLDSDFAVTESGDWIILDITTLYNNWKSGTNNYGLAIRFVRRAEGSEIPTAVDNITVATSEHATANYHPTLVVTGVSADVGKAYKANSTNFTDLFGTVGFVRSTVLSGANATIQTSGVISGLSGLTAGKLYYVTDSETISTTPGTISREVGSALSTTTLLIQSNFQQIQKDNFLKNAYDNNDEDVDQYWFVPLGFKPKMIRFDGVLQLNVSSFLGNGIYVNGSQQCVNYATSGTVQKVDGYLAYYVSGGEYCYFNVDSIYETGVLFRFRNDIRSGALYSAYVSGLLTFEQ